MALWQPVPPETFESPLSAPLPRPEVLFAAPGYSQPAPPRNALATTALVFGFVGVLFPLFAVVAVICGHIAARNNRRVGAHLVRGALGLGYGTLGIWALVILSIAVVG